MSYAFNNDKTKQDVYNTDEVYTKNEVDERIPNITISNEQPTSIEGENGDIWIVYSD